MTQEHVELHALCTGCRHPLVMLFTGGHLIDQDVVDGRPGVAAFAARKPLECCPSCHELVMEVFDARCAIEGVAA